MGLSNILMIPGVTDPVSEINSLLFGAGQQGTFIAPSLTPSLISGSTFGTGVETLPDLSPRNNPFSQATSGNRAAWFREPKTGRRNLLERTEQFDNAYWTKFASTVTPNAGTDPDGQTTADLLIPNTNNSQHSVLRTGFSAGTQTFSILAKAAGYNTIQIYLFDGAFKGQATARLDLGTVVISGTGTPTGAITAIGNGWYKVTLTATTSTSTEAGCYVGQNGSVSSFVGDNATGVLLSRFQLEAGSSPTAYQRVTTAFDVTEAGQRDCYGVRADGTDDNYQTASIDFTGTNKVTVFAAFRGSVSTPSGLLCELGSIANVNRFGFTIPTGVAANTFNFFTGGSVNIDNALANQLTFPETAILTGIGDIVAPLNRTRKNGVVVQSVTSSQGTGNYDSQPLNLFRRSGGTLPFNGNLYALIVAGGSYPLSTIQRVERLLSRITPTVNL
jgi:hypothetical protein